MKRRARRKWRFSETWLARWLKYRPSISERYCPKCNRPYVESPEPEPLEQVVVGSVAALVYPIRRGGRRDYVVRIGRWQPSRDRLWLSQLLDVADLDDVARATAEAQRRIARLRDRRPRESLRVAQR